MNPFKRLAGQTAIYGTTTIVGRLFNYLLVPFHVRIFAPELYGVVGEMYAYISLLLVILTYGMETAFFRFYESEKDKNKVFSTSMISLITTSTFFVIIISLLSQPLANIIRYPNHSEYIIWLAIIIAFDAISTVPFAKLRALNKAKRFATIKLLNIFIYGGLNIFFLFLCPLMLKHDIASPLINLIYSNKIGVGYIFIANVIASVITFLFLLPETKSMNFKVDFSQLKKMLWYAFPLLIFGLAGIINETMDRLFLKYLLPPDIAMTQVGIYSACYKISIMMTIFIQAFKYAAEPFFFSLSKELNARKIYADVTKYFVIACSLIFLVIMLYMDIVKHFVHQDYYIGLKVVPILLLANIFIGVFYNLSIWYKLTNQTRFGAYISVFGAILTIVLNYLLIPVMGFMGSAWTTFICYFAMMVVSFIIGQKYYKVDYKVKSILLYLLAAVGIYLGFNFIEFNYLWLKLFVASILIITYMGFAFFIERKNILKIIK